MLALWVTPRYGADMQWLLQLPLLPGLALAAAVGWWWAARLRGKLPRLALAPDGLFALFLGWVLLLAAWHAGTGTALAIEPLYHPVNYLYAAALYLAARTDPTSVAEQRHMAMALLACVLAAAGLHIGLERFHLNGHIAFLMAMAVPLAWALQRSATGAAERAMWWLALGLLTAGVVFNQNRSAMLGLAALALVAMAPTRMRWWLGVMLLVVLALLGLWWLGLLDRFASVIEPRWARQFDAMAEATVSSRFALWRASWEMLATAPLAGVGPGQFEATLARLSPSTENVPAHNTWLTLACETGAIGVVLAALAFVLAGFGGGAASARLGAAAQPNWSPQTIARQGLLVWLVFGMFNSRPDFVWAYFLAGWAVAWPPATRRHSNNRSALYR
jgi:O-antigen ligase